MRIFLATSLSFIMVSSSALASDWDVLNKTIQQATQFEGKESVERHAELVQKYDKTFTLTSEEKTERENIRNKITYQNELFNGEIERTILTRFRKAIENKDTQLIQSDLSKKMLFSNLSEIEKTYLNKVDGISYGEISNLKQMSGSADAFRSELAKYLNNYSKVEFAEIRITRTLSNVFVVGPTYKVLAHFDVRGLNPAGKHRTDKANAIMEFERNGKAPLKLLSFDVNYVQTARLDRAPAFQKMQANAGFDKGETYQRLEALRRGGYGFAIEDINNDGQLDAFVGNYGKSTLWTSKNGTFTQVSAPEIEKITLAKAAAFVDLDNDGWKDLFITRFSADKLVGDVILFKNEKGTFKEVKNAFPSNIIRDYAMPAAIADYNNDGLLDIYVGFPGSRDFSVGPSVPSKLTVHGLFINRGNFAFDDQTKKIQNVATQNVMPHGAMASDFDLDGNIDLIVMDDQANLSPIYRNDGKGQLVLNNSNMHIVNNGFGMGIASGDFNQDGLPDYILSNATFTSSNRLSETRDIANMVNRSITNMGVRLFVNSSEGRFSESTNIAGLGDPGDGAGGVTVVDYDNDGLQDIYLVNGLWSGSSREDTIDSTFAIGSMRNTIHLDHLQDGKGDSSARGTRSLYMRGLMAGKTPEGRSYSFGGHQRNRLFKNLGNGKFLEVGYLEGADSIADGYMSVVADINRDGKADLVLRNCDPGAKDYKFAPVELFQNNHKNASSVWVTLKGKKSNSSGVGAKLIASVGGKNLFREMSANNSAMQGEIVSHFGLGTAKKIDKLVIKWPSGITNTYKNIEPGRHAFEEKQESIASF